MLNQEIENIINEHNKIKQEVDSFLIKVASLSQITKEQYILYGQKIEHYRSIRTDALDKIDKLILKDNNQHKSELAIARNEITSIIRAISNELNVIADILLFWQSNIFK